MLHEEIHYCEDPLFGEFFQPLNSLSNLAFIVLAYLMWHYRKRNTTDTKYWFFCIMMFVVGIGSCSWHFYPAALTFYMDVVPIAIIFFVLAFYLIQMVFINRFKAISLYVIFLVYMVLSTLLLREVIGSGILNGVESYLAVFIFYVFMILNAIRFQRHKLGTMLWVLFYFTAALFFRQTDLIICSFSDFGVHFLWHICGALTTYNALRLIGVFSFSNSKSGTI